MSAGKVLWTKPKRWILPLAYRYQFVRTYESSMRLKMSVPNEPLRFSVWVYVLTHSGQDSNESGYNVLKFLWYFYSLDFEYSSFLWYHKYEKVMARNNTISSQLDISLSFHSDRLCVCVGKCLCLFEWEIVSKYFTDRLIQIHSSKKKRERKIPLCIMLC